MSAPWSVLPLGKHNCAQDGHEDQERGQLERVDELLEEEHRESFRGGQRAIQSRGGQVVAGARNRRGDEAGDCQRQRNARVGGQPGEIRALFLASVQKHDHEDEQHHDRAAVHNDLHGRDKFRAHEQVEARECHHHDDERERAVNRVLLQNQADRAKNGKGGKHEEDNQGRSHQCFPQIRMATLVRTTFAMDTGSRNFQPKLINWS